MLENTAATATATTHTIIPTKFSVQPAMLKTKTRLLIPCGTAVTGVRSVKNATASGKP